MQQSFWLFLEQETVFRFVVLGGLGDRAQFLTELFQVDVLDVLLHAVLGCQQTIC